MFFPLYIPVTWSFQLHALYLWRFIWLIFVISTFLLFGLKYFCFFVILTLWWMYHDLMELMNLSMLLNQPKQKNAGDEAY